MAMAAQSGQGGLSSHPGLRSAWEYPLLDAIFNRRSRRFALGTEIPGGPTKYRSQKEPLPLDEIEEALLVQAATGVSGRVLADLPYLDERQRDAGGNTVCHFVGLTWPSPCASHDTHLIYWNDEATYLVKFKDLSSVQLREYETLDDRQKIVKAFRQNRVKLLEGRLEHPRSFPTMLPFNIWSSNVPGSTMFLPIIDVTYEYINVLLLMCGWPDGGFFVIDDFNGGVPAGCERWATEGLLNRMMALPLSTLGYISLLESGFLIQNLLLAIQAMGLGGWVHAHPVGIVLLGGTPLAKGLGFRFVMPKRGVGGGRATPSPVGIDGVLEAYCPPYYPNMDGAVDAVVATKFGAKGIYSEASDQPAPFLARHEFLAAVPRHSEKVVQCVKDICNYIYDTYGRFPHVDAIQTPGSWVQAHHLDLDFYDRFYGAGAYTETQRSHMELWHGPEAEALTRAVAGAVAS